MIKGQQRLETFCQNLQHHKIFSFDPQERSNGVCSKVRKEGSQRSVICPRVPFPRDVTKQEEVKWKSLSRVRLFVTLWTVAHQAPLSAKFSGQEYWSGLPFRSLGDLPNPGIEPKSLALLTDSLTSEPQGSPWGVVGKRKFFHEGLRNQGAISSRGCCSAPSGCLGQKADNGGL